MNTKFMAWLQLLVAAKEALKELQPTVMDAPGYYADPEQVERLRKAISDVEEKIEATLAGH